MRVALIQDHLRNGGTEQQTIAIAASLAAKGVDTHLIVFKSGGTLSEKARAKNVRLHELKQGIFKFDWFAPGLSKFLAGIDPDLVIPMGRMANCHSALLPSSTKRSYKILATFRTGRSIPFLYRRALSESDHIVFNSRYARNRVRSQYGIDRPQQSSVIYNGCIRDFDTYIPAFVSPDQTPKSKQIHFCSVSMFRPQKKQIRLIQICSNLPENIDWKLTLAGSGSTIEQCKAEALKLNVQDRVEFPGLLKDPRSLYQAADIAVHTSDQESLPNFLVEAQMAGLPIVAYNVDGVGETFIDGKSGYLIDHLDENNFRAKLLQLIENPDIRYKMSKKAKQFANAHFTMAQQTEAYLKLAESLTSKIGNR